MTLTEFLATLERRCEDAAKMHATAPVAEVLGVVLEELRPLAGQSGEVAPARNGGSDRLLTAEQVAATLGTSVRWVYDHADQLGGRRLSRRCLRFPESAIRRYVERRR